MTATVPQTHLKPTSEVDFLSPGVLEGPRDYHNRPQSIAELKVAITQKIPAIRKEVSASSVPEV